MSSMREPQLVDWRRETRTRIYGSSKRQHVQTWLHYRTHGNLITSSWIDLVGEIDIEEVGQKYWPIWLREASDCEYLIFYAKPGDAPHTSNLLEIGAALAANRQIIHVGVSDTIKTQNGELADFAYHPNWRRHHDLEQALKLANLRVPAGQPLPDEFQ